MMLLLVARNNSDVMVVIHIHNVMIYCTDNYYYNRITNVNHIHSNIVDRDFLNVVDG